MALAQLKVASTAKPLSIADGVLAGFEPERVGQQSLAADQPVTLETRMGQDLDWDFRFTY